MRTLHALLRWFLVAAAVLEVLSFRVAMLGGVPAFESTQSANASSTFPAVVNQTLSAEAMMKVDITTGAAPPDGCLLCHKSEVGGTDTNNAFGLMMKAAGAVGANPGTVPAALGTLSQTAPRAITDIVEGINPNDDPTALSNDPVPQYGCGSIGGAGRRGDGAIAALLVVSGALVVALRRKRAERRRMHSA